MQLLNRITIFLKRILSHKLYTAMLLSLIFLTAVYTLLPEKSRSADIKVALYSYDSSHYSAELITHLNDGGSVYTFYTADSEDSLIQDVKSGYAECGYVIPDGFFSDYINGNSGANAMTQYVVPSTTLAATINESVFASIFKLCSGDILLLGVDVPSLDRELSERLNQYLDSDAIFRMESTTTGEFSYKTMQYHISIPIFEISLILLLFSGLLGLMQYLSDAERGIYIALQTRTRFQIRSISILTAIIPILAAGILSSLILHGFSGMQLYLIAYGVAVYILTLTLGLFIKKSTLFAKVLPLIMLLAIVTVFVSSLLIP